MANGCSKKRVLKTTAQCMSQLQLSKARIRETERTQVKTFARHSLDSHTGMPMKRNALQVFSLFCECLQYIP